MVEAEEYGITAKNVDEIDPLTGGKPGEKASKNQTTAAPSLAGCKCGIPSYTAGKIIRQKAVEQPRSAGGKSGWQSKH